MNKSSGDKMVAQPERLQFYNRPRQVKFEGCIDALKAHIYDCIDSCQTDLYKNDKSDCQLCDNSFKDRNDVKIAIETLTVPTMKLTNDLPENSSAAQKRHWEKRMDEISK